MIRIVSPGNQRALNRSLFKHDPYLALTPHGLSADAGNLGNSQQRKEWRGIAFVNGLPDKAPERMRPSFPAAACSERCVRFDRVSRS